MLTGRKPLLIGLCKYNHYNIKSGLRWSTKYADMLLLDVPHSCWSPFAKFSLLNLDWNEKKQSLVTWTTLSNIMKIHEVWFSKWLLWGFCLYRSFWMCKDLLHRTVLGWEVHPLRTEPQRWVRLSGVAAADQCELFQQIHQETVWNRATMEGEPVEIKVHLGGEGHENQEPVSIDGLESAAGKLRRGADICGSSQFSATPSVQQLTRADLRTCNFLPLEWWRMWFIRFLGAEQLGVKPFTWAPENGVRRR